MFFSFKGYCDVFLKCRAVDAEGPLVRLKNLLFNKRTLQTVAQWITENWYAAVFIGIIFVIIMGIFVKCCAVHTPSSNPKKPPARRISDTLRHPMNTLRRMVLNIYNVYSNVNYTLKPIFKFIQRHPNSSGGAGPRSIPPPNDRSRSAGVSGNIPIPHGRRSQSNRASNTAQGTSQAYSDSRPPFSQPKSMFKCTIFFQIEIHISFYFSTVYNGIF